MSGTKPDELNKNSIDNIFSVLYIERFFYPVSILSNAYIYRVISIYRYNLNWLYERKQNCKFLQMYLCRIRFRETIPKISFNMSTICINYQLKTLRESLTRVTNDFLVNFGPLLPQLTFRTSKLWCWTVETLLSRYDQIPKFRGFRSGEEDTVHSSFVIYGTFSESHSWVFWPHVMVQSPAEKTRDGFWSTLVPRARMLTR